MDRTLCYNCYNYSGELARILRHGLFAARECGDQPYVSNPGGVRRTTHSTGVPGCMPLNSAAPAVEFSSCMPQSDHPAVVLHSLVVSFTEGKCGKDRVSAEYLPKDLPAHVAGSGVAPVTKGSPCSLTVPGATGRPSGRDGWGCQLGGQGYPSLWYGTAPQQTSIGVIC